MGKGILDERHPLFGGCYAGSNSLPPVKDELESSDFVLYVGALKSDFNSGSFTVGIPTEHAVRLHSFTTNVGYAAFPTTDIRHVLPLLLPAFQKVKGPPALQDSLEDKIKAGRVLAPKDTPDNDGGKIVHAWLWQRMAGWFKDHGGYNSGRAHTRRHHHRDGHEQLRPPPRAPPQPVHVRHPGAVGQHRVECGRGAGVRPRGPRAGRAPHRALRRRRVVPACKTHEDAG